MTTFLMVALTSIISYHIGRRVGIAYAMVRMQHLIEEMQQIQMFFKGKQQQWNEDQL